MELSLDPISDEGGTNLSKSRAKLLVGSLLLVLFCWYRPPSLHTD